MANHRIARAAEDIKREISQIIQGMKDPRVHQGLLSVVRVELAGDMTHCKVYVSSVEGLETTKEAVAGLKSGAGFIRREIGARLGFKNTPELHFVADNSIEYSADIAKKLDDLL